MNSPRLVKVGTALTALAFSLVAPMAASAASEKEILEKCEYKICDLIVNKKTDGGKIACELVKTWGADEIKKGAAFSKLSWSWGDAKCTTSVNLDSANLAKSVTEASHDLKLAPVPVTCYVGDKKDEGNKIGFTLAPTMKFENGKATTANLNIDNIEGGFWKRAAVKTVQLVESSNVLSGVIVKDVNKFMHDKCPHRLKELAPKYQ